MEELPWQGKADPIDVSILFHILRFYIPEVTALTGLSVTDIWQGCNFTSGNVRTLNLAVGSNTSQAKKPESRPYLADVRRKQRVQDRRRAFGSAKMMTRADDLSS